MIQGYVRLRATLPVQVGDPTSQGYTALVVAGDAEFSSLGPTAEDAVAALLQDLQRAGFATALTSGPDLPGQGVLEL